MLYLVVLALKYRSRSVRGLAVGLVAVLVLSGASATEVRGQSADALAKEIQRALGGVQFRITSDPARAEKQLIEANEKFLRLKAEAPAHALVPTLEKKIDDLAGKLEKRLNRSVAFGDGGAAPPADETATAAKLPGGVEYRLKTAEKELDKAEAAVESGTSSTATRSTATVERLLREIERSYGDQVPADHPRLATAQQRLAALRSGTAPRAAPATAPVAKPAAEQELPGGVTYRLKQANQALDRADKYIAEGRYDRAESYVLEARGAQGLMAEIKDKYGDRIPPGHPEVTATEERLAGAIAKITAAGKAAAEAEAQEAAAAKQREAQSAEWFAKLEPYYSGQGYFVLTGTSGNVSEIKKGKANYEKLAAVMAEYDQVDFPAGKSGNLEMLEKDIRSRLEQFPKAYEESIARVMQPAASSLGQALAFLESGRSDWENDPAKKPPILDSDRMAGIRDQLSDAREVAGGTDRFGELERKLAALEALDAEHRRIRAERTFMTPDRFEGDELNALKSVAAAIVKEEADAEILRVSVISPDWTEENVKEWTDTTRTTIRHRITRSVSAQVAGKRPDKVYLYTVHVAKDKRSDGSWGKLYGHVMATDWMAEKNVDRDEP